MVNITDLIHLEAVPKKDLCSSTSVISTDQIDYYIWIHIPNHMSLKYVMYDADVIEGKHVDNLFDNIEHESGPWYKIRSSFLDIEDPGHKLYRFKFVNTVTNDSVYLYSGYILQNSNPDKPYVYMHRSELSYLDTERIPSTSDGYTGNYETLSNKPKINKVTLNKNKTSSQLGLQDQLDSFTPEEIDEIINEN